MTISDKNTRIMITISKETKVQLERLAKQEQLPISGYCSKIITETINKKVGE